MVQKQSFSDTFGTRHLFGRQPNKPLGWEGVSKCHILAEITPFSDPISRPGVLFSKVPCICTDLAQLKMGPKIVHLDLKNGDF